MGNIGFLDWGLLSVFLVSAIVTLLFHQWIPPGQSTVVDFITFFAFVAGGIIGGVISEAIEKRKDRAIITLRTNRVQSPFRLLPKHIVVQYVSTFNDNPGYSIVSNVI